MTMMALASAVTATTATGKCLPQRFFRTARIRLKRRTFAASSSSSVDPLVTEEEESSLAAEIQRANETYDGKIEIRSTDTYGWGLFSLKEWKVGELVMTGYALEVTTHRDQRTIQTDHEQHVTMDLPARSVNHACGRRANVGIRPCSSSSSQPPLKIGSPVYDFVALTNIQSGEQVLWDYETTEYELSHSFVCSCGSDECRGVLKGFRYHREQVIQAYGSDWIAPYLLTASTSEESKRW